MEFGTSTALLRAERGLCPHGMLTILEALGEAGFRWIDYNIPTDFHDDSGPDHAMREDGWRQSCETYRAFAEANGMRFYQTHNLMFNYFEDTPAAQENNRLVDRCLEITALLGGGVSVMHPVAPPGAEYDRDACLRANRDYFLRKAEVAERFGVRIAVENMLTSRYFDGTVFKRYCTGIDELTELVGEINHPLVGICIDTGHAHYMGHNIYDAVTACDDWLIALHIHDNNRFDDQHLTPYCGTLDWDACLRALADVGYRGHFTLEILHACERMPPRLQPGFAREVSRLAAHMAARIDEMRGR